MSTSSILNGNHVDHQVSSRNGKTKLLSDKKNEAIVKLRAFSENNEREKERKCAIEEGIKSLSFGKRKVLIVDVWNIVLTSYSNKQLSPLDAIKGALKERNSDRTSYLVIKFSQGKKTIEVGIGLLNSQKNIQRWFL